jgi:hypothetical protein
MLMIKNTSLFFIGLIILMMGIFIVVFDLPQIQYFENLEGDSYLSLEDEKKDFHQRLKMEFYFGVTFLLFGVGLLIFSLIKKTEKME